MLGWHVVGVAGPGPEPQSEHEGVTVSDGEGEVPRARSCCGSSCVCESTVFLAEVPGAVALLQPLPPAAAVLGVRPAATFVAQSFAVLAAHSFSSLSRMAFASLTASLAACSARSWRHCGHPVMSPSTAKVWRTCSSVSLGLLAWPDAAAAVPCSMPRPLGQGGLEQRPGRAQNHTGNAEGHQWETVLQNLCCANLRAWQACASCKPNAAHQQWEAVIAAPPTLRITGGKLCEGWAGYNRKCNMAS
jgi:hypothetical protein